MRLYIVTGQFALIYLLKGYPITRLPDREISLPDCYPVINYTARVLQSLILAKASLKEPEIINIVLSPKYLLIDKLII